MSSTQRETASRTSVILENHALLRVEPGLRAGPQPLVVVLRNSAVVGRVRRPLGAVRVRARGVHGALLRAEGGIVAPARRGPRGAAGCNCGRAPSASGCSLGCLLPLGSRSLHLRPLLLRGTSVLSGDLCKVRV